MSCQPERVTGYVDGALDEAARAEVGRHLASCPACREQAEAERVLREKLRALPRPELPPDVDQKLRRRLASAAPRRAAALRRALPLAASLALLALWGRGAAPVVAWQLARDHGHCFSFATLPAQVWSDDALEVTRWCESSGQRVPWVPERVGGLSLVGARRCPILDRRVAHVYYTGDDRRVSLFAIPGTVRAGDGYTMRALGRTVRLLRIEGVNVGLVGESAEDVEEFERSLRTTAALARLLDESPRTPRD